MPVGVKILGVEPDGKVHEGRGDVLAAYVEDGAQLSALLEKVGNDVMAVVVDYPPCVRPGEGGLLVPVADWLSASTLEKMKAKVAVLNKDRGLSLSFPPRLRLSASPSPTPWRRPSLSTCHQSS